MALLKRLTQFDLLRFIPLEGLRRPPKFQASPTALKVYQAVIAHKVALIERLPPKYRHDVQQVIWQAVIRGYDCDGLAQQLTDRFGLAPHRATLVADAQCNMARSVIDNAQRIEQGVKQAVWRHDSRCPIASHRGLSGRRYALARGIDVEGQRVWPSGEPSCVCNSADVEESSQASDVQ